MQFKDRETARQDWKRQTDRDREKGGQAGKTDRQGHRETDRPDRWSYR